MNGLVEYRNFATYFPIFFASMWLIVTTILAIASGWFRLMRSFPNQAGEPIVRLRHRSGTMGLGVGMRGIPTLSACPPGLRVGMMRIFGPFCRDFMVPWESITVTRKTRFFWPVAKLQFGSPAIGSLTVSADVADRLGRAAVGRWPEARSFPAENRSRIFRRLSIQWALQTVAASSFFIFVPMFVAPAGGHPPVIMAVLFPAIVFGVVAIFRFLGEMK